ncbi:MAG: NUDIX hydrolase [Pseudomonadales bacterium]|nr:NUDIX hydrolase [Pseudomonadales bacterium]
MGLQNVTDTPIRPAATVIIVRDAQPQYEIFMLRRTNQAAFAGGMYVFPGGRVDDHDHDPVYNNLHGEPSPFQAAQREALGDDWQAYWIAGIRETFEEAGLLLAYHQDGELFRIDAACEPRFNRYRKQLHDGGVTLAEICATENLNLAIDLIHFYNRWVTPLGRPRRFDTRFFITQAPGDQAGFHDGIETVDSLWISPDEALKKHAAGEFGLMRVTERQLSDFAQYRSAAEFLDMAKNNRDFPFHQPVLPPAD